MLELFQLGGASTPQEQALVLLLLVIGVLLVVTVTFSVLAIVVRARHQARDRRAATFKSRWEVAVLSAVDDPAAIPAAHALVGDGEGLSFVGFVLEYTRRVRGDERSQLRELVAPFMDSVAARAEARRSEVRARAIQTLGTLGLPDYEDLVVAALDDRSPLVAMVAARALAREETPQYADAVLARLPRFRGWSRNFLAAMLAAIGQAVSQLLRDGLADAEAEPWTRAVLAEALRIQADFLAADVAADVLTESDDRELLAASLRLLTEVGRPEHIPRVLRHVEADDVVVRTQALQAAGRLGGDGEVPTLAAAMGDESSWAALYAARGVRDAGGRRLLQELAASSDPRALLAEQVLSEEAAM